MMFGLSRELLRVANDADNAISPVKLFVSLICVIQFFIHMIHDDKPYPLANREIYCWRCECRKGIIHS